MRLGCVKLCCADVDPTSKEDPNRSCLTVHAQELFCDDFARAPLATPSSKLHSVALHDCSDLERQNEYGTMMVGDRFSASRC